MRRVSPASHEPQGKGKEASSALVKHIDRFIAEYVDTGRFLEERYALRRQVHESTWSHWIGSWLRTYACCSEARK